jgi:hypothetical protein
MIWFQLALFVISFLLTALLTPKPEFENARPQQLNDVNFPRATEDAPIPLILGKARMNAPNTIWFGDFSSIPITVKVKTGLFSSKRVVVGHRYFLGVDLALGMGPDLQMSEIYMDDKLLWSGTVSPTVPTTITIDKPSFWGGYKDGGGWTGTATYYPGGLDLTGNPINSYVEGVVGVGEVPGYIGTAHIVFEGNYIGETAQLRKMAFVMENHTNDLGGLPDSGKVGDDMNPAEAIYQIFVNKWRGMGVSPGDLDITALRALGNTCHAEGNGVSIVITAETQGSKLIQEIMRQVDGIAHQDPDTGKIVFKLIRGDYDVASLPIYDEDDIIKVTNFSRTGWDEVVSQVKISFPQRDKESNAVAVSQDMATITMIGRMRSTTLSMPFVYDKSLANQIASRERAQLSVPLFRITLEMNRNANTLRPGDVFRLNWPDYGFSNLVMRVQEFDFGSLLDGRLVVKCLQDSFALNTVIFADPPDSGWVAPVVNPVPIAVNEIVEMPRFYQKKLENPIQDGFASVIALPLKPSTASSSFDMVTGVATGDSNLDTREPQFAPYPTTATIVTPYSKNEGFVSGVDSSTGLVIDNLIGLLIPASSGSQIKEGERGIFYSNGEWMGFTSFTDNLNGTYTLNNIHRGLFGTSPIDHAVSQRIWQVVPDIFPDGNMDNLSETGTVFYKLMDRVGSASIDITEVPELSSTMQDIADRPARPRNVKLDGTRTPAIVETTDLDLTWISSNRESLLAALETDPSEIPDQPETYDVDVMVSGVRNTSLSSSGVSSPHTIPFSSTNINDTNCEVRVLSRRTSGDLKSSVYYAWLPFELNQSYAIGDVNYFDTYGGLDSTVIVSMYSLRKRISTYIGSAVRVRDTNDNSEQDVGFDAAGNLAAFTVVGEARVVTLYDQSSAGLDLTQPTAADQPLLDITGAPNGSPCIDFSGGVYTLKGPSFSDASPNAHLIARPTWILSAVGDTGGSFRYAVHIPHDGSAHYNPYYRMGVLWEPDEGIETRWNGGIVTWGGAAWSGVSNAILMADLKEDPLLMKTYYNSSTLNSSKSASGSMTAPNTTHLRLGTNPINGENWNGKFMELMIGDFSVSKLAMRDAIYTEMNSEWFI